MRVYHLAKKVLSERKKQMKERNLKKVLLILSIISFCNFAHAQDNRCDIPDVGTLSPGEVKTKTSLLHIWQGAKGGLNTKNADRITGLYDFDLLYLLSAEEDKNNKGDYTLLNFSAQTGFGHGLSGNKVGSYFELNENAKGNLDPIIDKLYIEFTAFDRLLTFDVGKMDLMDFFDCSAVAGDEKEKFIAFPFYRNPTIPFPSKGLGVRVLYEPSDFWYAQAAIADAEADKRETGFSTTFGGEDYFTSLAEIGIRPNLFNMPGTYRFTVWYDDQKKSYIDGSNNSKSDDVGYSVSFDQQIAPKTTAFFRYGWADNNVNELENFVSVGGQIKGLLEGREEDTLAVGYARGGRSADGLSSEDARQIDLIETYYRIKVNDNLSVTPSVQFAMNPGGLKDESTATIFGVRCRYKF